ncbi:hypothetical protein J5X84_32735 [Streptosporangiaceae bacterium NEAU-GS5]|nr:hypothetical protein [Streptosporangiaceae bacterium NEAU-GS5]
MSRLGPTYTLAAGAVLAVVLGAASLKSSPAIETASADQNVTTAATPSAPEPTPIPAPEPSETAAPDTTPKKVDYAGVVQGNGGLVALAIRNGRAVAYFCDGHIESWLKGKAENNTLVLEGKNALITAALGGGKAQGKIEFQGHKWRFVAPVVKRPSGLYRATALVRGARIVGGWIKLPTGQTVGKIESGNAGESAPYFDGGPVDWYGVTLQPQTPDTFIDGDWSAL